MCEKIEFFIFITCRSEEAYYVIVIVVVVIIIFGSNVSVNIP